MGSVNVQPGNDEERERNLRLAFEQAAVYARELHQIYRDRASARAELDAKLAEMELLQRQLLVYAEDLAEMYHRLESTYLTTLQALAIAVESRDEETGGHSQRVTHYSLVIGEQMGLNSRQLKAIRYGAPLHDIGKIAIPDAILKKDTSLSAEEWREMRRHPQLGHQMLHHIEFLSECLPIVIQHHERWDGQGYPLGLQGKEIDLGARIFAIADALDAMTSDRPYRKALSFDRARDELLQLSGSQFDPQMVQAFVAVFDRLREPQGASRS